MNPYDAPRALAQTTPALPAWTVPILRAALVVIALDFARGTAWRLMSTVSGAFLDHFNPNVPIQLVFAVALVFAITAVVRRREGGVVAAPVLRLACIATAIAAVSMYVTRLVVDAVAGTYAGANLGVATLALDSIAVALAALYVAAVLAEVRAVEACRRVRTLTAIYAAATWAALIVVANNAQRHGFLPPGSGSPIRTIATLVFVFLAFLAYRFVATLARR